MAKFGAVDIDGGGAVIFIVVIWLCVVLASLLGLWLSSLVFHINTFIFGNIDSTMMSSSLTNTSKPYIFHDHKTHECAITCDIYISGSLAMCPETVTHHASVAVGTVATSQ